MLDAGVCDTMEAMSASLVYLLLRQVLRMLTLRVPKTPSVQVMRRVHTRAGCRPGGHAGGC